MKINALYTLLVLFIGFLYSCEKPNQEEIDCQQKEFNIDVFIANVHDKMQEESISGYQFAVNRNASLYHNQSYGFARHEDDPGGEIPMTVFTQHNVASVSKFVAAIALMNALEERSIHVDSSAVDWLPDSWIPQVHEDFKDEDKEAFLTFHQILTTTTAIDFLGPGGDWLREDNLLEGLKLPPNLGKMDEYQNANFAIIRLLIGKIIFDIMDVNPTNTSEYTEKYFQYLREVIFEPLDISAPLTPQAMLDYYATPTYPLGYQWPFNPFFDSPDLNEHIGWNHKNNPFNAGSSGLVLSSRDLSKLLIAFKYDVPISIISNEQRQLIFENRFGLRTTRNFDDRPYAPYYAKNGAKSDDCNGCGRALKSVVVFFPNDVEGVLMTNSKVESIGTLLVEAYDNSYVFPCD